MHAAFTRREWLRLSAGALLSLGVWPGRLRGADAPAHDDFTFIAVNHLPGFQRRNEVEGHPNISHDSHLARSKPVQTRPPSPDHLVYSFPFGRLSPRPATQRRRFT